MRTTRNDLSISYSTLGTYPFGCPFSANGFFFFLAENSKWFLDYNITDFLMVYLIHS